jgi:hypothetical protein
MRERERERETCGETLSCFRHGSSGEIAMLHELALLSSSFRTATEAQVYGAVWARPRTVRIGIEYVRTRPRTVRMPYMRHRIPTYASTYGPYLLIRHHIHAYASTYGLYQLLRVIADKCIRTHSTYKNTVLVR